MRGAEKFLKGEHLIIDQQQHHQQSFFSVFLFASDRLNAFVGHNLFSRKNTFQKKRIGVEQSELYNSTKNLQNEDRKSLKLSIYKVLPTLLLHLILKKREL